MVFLFDSLEFFIKFLFEERVLRLKELKVMVLELRMVVLVGMRGKVFEMFCVGD